MFVKSRNALASSMGRPLTGAVQVSKKKCKYQLKILWRFFLSWLSLQYLITMYLTCVASFMLHFSYCIMNSGWGSTTHDGSQCSRLQLLFNPWWVCWCQKQVTVFLKKYFLFLFINSECLLTYSRNVSSKKINDNLFEEKSLPNRALLFKMQFIFRSCIWSSGSSQRSCSSTWRQEWGHVSYFSV